jgi:copper/silver efflux system protein
MLNKIIRFFLENKLVTVLLLTGLVAWGIVTSPFGWQIEALPSDPVPVDAIPDIGENQQIVFTEWMGRSPQDIEDQISYPLTTYLLGIPGVKSIRSSSIFGFSSILSFSKKILSFTGRDPGYWKSWLHFRQDYCLKECSLHWVPMPQRWGRFSGTQ